MFVDSRHLHYQAGAALELALLALAVKDKAAAWAALKRLTGLAAGRDFRWQRSSLIVESRLWRLEGDRGKALEVANDALALARSQREIIGQIDALVARSEAYGRTGSGEAIEDLKVGDWPRANHASLSRGTAYYWSFPHYRFVSRPHCHPGQIVARDELLRVKIVMAQLGRALRQKFEVVRVSLGIVRRNTQVQMVPAPFRAARGTFCRIGTIAFRTGYSVARWLTGLKRRMIRFGAYTIRQ
jgi:hypothetical protein